MTNNLSREKLISRATDLKVIPSLNDIVEKVFSVLGNNNSSFNDLRNVVQYDQAISSKIISIANSAYYSRGVEILELQRAMLTIGFEELRGTVTCLMFVENILKKLKLEERDLFTLWKHAIQVACGAKTLSERMLVEDPPQGVHRVPASGMRILEAVSGDQAIRVFERHKDEIDVVFPDVIMPGLKGDEVLKRLREIREDVKVIISSGFMSEDQREKLKESTVGAFLDKPIKDEDIIAVLIEVLSK